MANSPNQLATYTLCVRHVLQIQVRHGVGVTVDRLVRYQLFQFLIMYENVKLLRFNANVHVFRRITRRLYDYCIREKLVDGMLAAKWKKGGSCYVKIDLVGYVVSCSSKGALVFANV